jgi:hypothetical protein
MRWAAHEYRIVQSFDHAGILDAREHKFGSALLIAYEPG